MMKLTKKVIAAVLIAGFLATFLALPQAAEAGGRHWNHGGPRYYHHDHDSSAAPFFGGLAFGAVTGLVVGSILAAPPVVVQPALPVVYQPVPVYVQPAPVCSSYWVNPYWNGYQWMPGYWTQACR
jgi:hypothetical protein